MNEYGLVSIITPNYNCSRFVVSTIKSVLAQTYPNWELLIQDDYSTDDSIAIIEQFSSKDQRIKLERNQKNMGAAITRNIAIKRSEGQWLAFLDSDDIWLPNKLEKQLSFMKENNCEFSFTRYEHISEDNKSLGLQANITKHISYRKMMMHCWPGCLTVIYKQDIFNKVYCEDIEKNNDTALFLRAIKTCKNGMGIDECLALYRIRKGSISRNKWEIIQPFVKVIYKFENQNLLFAYFCVFSHIMIKFFFKYRRISLSQSAAQYLCHL